jgi:hypothetical protein
MRRVDFLVLAALLASASIAEARPSTASMTCAVAAATVAKAGAIVLSTGAHTYDRFVASNGFCMSEELPTPAQAPTLDNEHCAIGYVCRQRAPDSDHN